MANRKRKSGRRSSSRGDQKKGKMEEEEDHMTEEESQEAADAGSGVVDNFDKTIPKKLSETKVAEEEQPSSKRKRSSSRSKTTNNAENEGQHTSSSQESCPGSQSKSRRSSGRISNINTGENVENQANSQSSLAASQGSTADRKDEDQDGNNASKSKSRRSSSRPKKADKEEENLVEDIDLQIADIEQKGDDAGDEATAMSDADDSIYHSAESTKDGDEAVEEKQKADEITLAEELGIEDAKMDAVKNEGTTTEEMKTGVEIEKPSTDSVAVVKPEANTDVSMNIVEMNELDVTDSQLCNFNESEEKKMKEQEGKAKHESLRSGSAIIKDLMQDLADMNRLITRARNDLNATKARLSTKWQMTF